MFELIFASVLLLGFLSYFIGQEGVWNVVKNFFKGCLAIMLILIIIVVIISVLAYIILHK